MTTRLKDSFFNSFHILFIFDFFKIIYSGYINILIWMYCSKRWLSFLLIHLCHTCSVLNPYCVVRVFSCYTKIGPFIPIFSVVVNTCHIYENLLSSCIKVSTILFHKLVRGSSSFGNWSINTPVVCGNTLLCPPRQHTVQYHAVCF